MGIFLKLMAESVRFAWQVLTTNLLRTTLSLLGVTIGIMLIIAVFTFVDSLEKNVKDSFDFLGSNVVSVDKFSFVNRDPNTPFYVYFRRPSNTYAEYTHLSNNLKSGRAVTFFGRRSSTIKYKNSSVSSIDLFGITQSYKDVYEVDVKYGRYFTMQETNGGRNVAIIGDEVATSLFPYESPIGKEIKTRGRKLVVIGVLQKEGKSLLGTPSSDDRIYMPYKQFTKMFYVGRFGVSPTIAAKGYESDVGMLELQSEMEGMIRKVRAIRPSEDSNFELNRPEAIADVLSGVFDIFGIAGAVIGSFAILVGGFGIMNIMFVSVQERTRIIGIQKSLGAKNYFILFQFLFESVFLCLIGGAIGVLIVYLLTFISFDPLVVELSFKNILKGVVISSVIGIVAGIIPSARAARLDPVEAIRQ